jgi:hypothetical protein
MHGADGGDWIWMTFAMSFWLILIGLVVYAAVRLGTRDRHGSER